MTIRVWNTVIVGGGPAAAVQLSRTRDPHNTLVVAESLGGGMAVMGRQRLQSYMDELRIERAPSPLRSHLGELWPTGAQYTDYVRQAVLASGAAQITGSVTDVSRSGERFAIQLERPGVDSAQTVYARRLILATGNEAIRAPEPWASLGARDFMRVYADIEAQALDFYRGAHVLVVGCGNTAMQLAGRLAAHARSVTILGRRYVGLYPIETGDRFAWRAASASTLELIAKSASYRASKASAPYDVRYLVYDSLESLAASDTILLRYRGDRNESWLGRLSLNEASRRQPAVRTSGGGLLSEHYDRADTRIVWAVGVRPRYPDCKLLSSLPKTDEGYVLTDDNGQTSVPGLYLTGACRTGCRAVNEMQPADLATGPSGDARDAARELEASLCGPLGATRPAIESH